MKRRSSLRLRGYDYGTNGAYFLTIVAKNRERLFGEIKEGVMRENELGRIVRDIWTILSIRFPDIALDAFVVMPNHIHGIIWIQGESSQNGVGVIHELPHEHSNQRAIRELPLPQERTLSRRAMLIPKIVGFLKMNASKRIRKTIGNQPIWQRNYYEHVIRNEDFLQRIRTYIEENPRKWQQDSLMG